MVELEYKAALVGALEYHGWDVQRHEDKHENFIADLSFATRGVDGWIEVKWCPKPPESLHAIHHWTAGQEEWLRSRGRNGSGNTFLLVGTPELHVVWRYKNFSHVRPISWGKAVNSAWMKDYTLPRLVEQMHSAIGRRA